VWSKLRALTLVVLCACSSDSLGPKTNLVLATPPDFSARVYFVEFESGNGPGFGAWSQHNVWVIIPPASAANAGVIVSTRSPVFLRTRDGIFVSDGNQIRPGDTVDVWRQMPVAYGALQGPPGAPTYTSTQFVIDR